MPQAPAVARVGVSARAEFLTRAYMHLLLAVFGLVGFELALFQSGAAARIARAFGSVNWLLILGGFMIVGWLARSLAHGSGRSLALQYLALAGYVVAKGLILVPLLYAADNKAPGLIQSAAFVTVTAFLGLTAVVYTTRKDFTFLRPFLRFVGICALVAIVAAVLFGFRLGTWFSVAMVLVAGGSILSDTSAVMRRYPTDRYVGASLELFASIAFMFWYVLRLHARHR